MRRVKKSLIAFFTLSLIFSPLTGASDYYASNSKTTYEHGEANYFEKWLGVMEVGSTSLETLKLYIGEGESIKNPFGETVYYIDNKNQKTLIV